MLAAALAGPRLVLAQGVTVTPLPGATTLSDPLDLVNAHDGSGRLFIVQQGGKIMLYKNGAVLPTPFLDASSVLISGGEQGLLGAAFHPNYPAVPFFYVNYTCRVMASQPECITSGDTIIARFQVSADPDVADFASRVSLIEIPQPFSNHNSGDLIFGPDGYLWIPMGDGGSGFDPDCRSQRDDSLLGKLLRIDVNQNVNTPPYYGIPPDNPYIGGGDPADEVYARGFRNPFRFSFDRQTGDLIVGDVGQNTTEEVDLVPVGTAGARNFGWKIMEGNGCTNDNDNCPSYVPPCNSPLFTPPILTYGHGLGDCAIIGGFRYRGTAIPSLVGTYLYSDNCTGTLRQGVEDAQGQWTGSVLLETGAPISAFGEDENGELYMTALGGGNGTVYQILPVASVVSVSDVSVAEGNSGTSTVNVPVSIAASPGQAVTVDYATADGTATAGSDYVATSGTLSFPASNSPQTQMVSVTINGDSQNEPDESFLLNLSNAQGGTIGNGQGVVTIANDDAALSINDVSVTEGNAGTTTAAFTVTLSPSSSQAVTVNFVTSDGTATAGSDYIPTSGSLSFAAGVTTQTVNVTVNGDTVNEPDETFFVNLSGSLNAAIADGQAIGTITNDDGPPPTPVLSVDDVSLPEGNTGTSNATFTVTLSPASTQTVSVDFATADGTATAGSDYVAGSGTLTFAPGETTHTVDVTINGDTTVEPDETFFLNLTNPTGDGTIGDGQGLGTIQNDDVPPPVPVVSSGDCTVAEGDTGTTPCLFPVSLSAPSTDTVSVDVNTADGTATANSDYLPIAPPQTIVFAPGETTQMVSVGVIGDTLVEGDETFSLILSNPVNATLGTNGTGTIIDDDFGPGGPPHELTHGSVEHADLAGGTSDLYRLAQAPRASYEVVLDGTTGDAFPGLQLQRLDPDGVTVLQSANATGTGNSLSLSFENPTAVAILDQDLSVNSPACGAGCTSEDEYRLRAYETTARIARFNNSATQVTIVVLANTTSNTITGNLHFWSAAGGSPLASQSFSIAAHGTFVFASASLPALQGHSGSITVSHDAAYGSITGKAVAVEPATGFTFDSPMEWRPR
jgi:glucose/arabinose dehydrogenase